MGTYNSVGVFNRRPVYFKHAVKPWFATDWNKYDWVYFDWRYGWVAAPWYASYRVFSLYTKHRGLCPISQFPEWIFQYNGKWYLDRTLKVECVISN